jgi:hypothetical protein
VQRRFRLQRAGAIGASSMITLPTESDQGNLESCIECVPRLGRGAGRTAASEGGGGAALSRVLQGPGTCPRLSSQFHKTALTTTPADTVVLCRHRHRTVFGVADMTGDELSEPNWKADLGRF